MLASEARSPARDRPSGLSRPAGAIARLEVTGTRRDRTNRQEVYRTMDGSPTDAFTTAQSRRTVLVAGALGGAGALLTGRGDLLGVMPLVRRTDRCRP